MRRLLLIGVLVAALTFLLVGTAAADNGPHQGDFTSTTDACAGCHRVHRGAAEKLLKEGATQTEFCYTCHGTNGTGADTNVQDGIYLDRDGVVEDPAEGTADAGLRGGGFDNALMDTNVDGSTGSAATTSKHDVDAQGTIWGNGDTGSGKSGVTLRCGSCHNPHGIKDRDNYRILRPKPKDSDAGSDVYVDDETDKNYTISYQTNNFRDTTYLQDVISQWCAQCHTRYHSLDTGDSGDAIFKYRHKTDGGKKCMTCHVAHGTSAAMGTYSDAVEWPDGSAATSGANSRLLHVDNRGVCYQCHPSP